MPKPLFRVKPNRITTPLERKAQAERIKVTTTIRRICEKKRAEGRVPARVTWRELRDIFTADEFKMLSWLIESKVIKVTEAINWNTYEVDEAELVRFEERVKKFETC